MTCRPTGIKACHACLSCDFTSNSGKVKIMRMLTTAGRSNLLAILGISAIAVTLCGCPSKKEPVTTPKLSDKPASATKTEPAAKHEPKAQPPSAKTPAKTETAEEQVTEAIDQAAKKPRDLGPPLVDNPAGLARLHPQQPVWIDIKNKQVILQGEVCAANYALEFFATYPNRSYEAVLSVNVQPSVVHTGLLAVGAKEGHPATFQPKFSPPTGTEVAIEVRWKGADGKTQSAPAQQWIRNIKTKKALDTNWVFAGSVFTTDETGHRSYWADSGELICVLNLPGAMLDLPMRSDGALEARIFEAFTEHLPPQDTPVTIVLKPILSPASSKPTLPKSATVKPTEKKAVAKDTPAEAEKKAADAATAWLALVDRGEYSQARDTAAALLKNITERREFIKTVSDLRKPRGPIKSRQLDSKQFVASAPGSPDGQCVLQFKTSFANQTSAAERVTLMVDKDRKWRVSGYYIK